MLNEGLGFAEVDKNLYRVEVDFFDSRVPLKDQRMLTRVASWQDLSPVAFARGRRFVVLTDNAPLVHGLSFDAYELSGIGVNPFDIKVGTNILIQTGSPIQPPSVDNFIKSHGDILQTKVVRNGRLEILTHDYVPTGSYAKAQALQKLRNSQKVQEYAGINFVVPIPIALGHYPNLVDPKGIPLHFLIFQVPFSGLRADLYSQLVLTSGFGNFLKYTETLSYRIARALHTLHDAQLVHNQPHPGNYATAASDFYLADWQTLTELDQTKPQIATACELHSAVDSLYALLEEIGGMEQKLGLEAADQEYRRIAQILVSTYLNREIDTELILNSKGDLSIPKLTQVLSQQPVEKVASIL